MYDLFIQSDKKKYTKSEALFSVIIIGVFAIYEAKTSVLTIDSPFSLIYI